NLSLVNGNAGFSIEGVEDPHFHLPPLDPQNLQPQLSTKAIVIRFDPTIAGQASDTLRIESNTMGGGTVNIPLTGLGVSADGDIRVTVANNNVGGLALSAAPRTVEDFGTIENIGSQALTLTQIG